MAHINSYLTFNGNCKEAMTFYKNCFGGDLVLQTIGESPFADKMPPQMRECILHASLTKNKLVLLGSDMISNKGLLKGNAVSMALDCESETDAKNYYTKLSAGGEATHPLEISFWGTLFGGLTDKYGNHWLVHFDKNKK